MKIGTVFKPGVSCVNMEAFNAWDLAKDSLGWRILGLLDDVFTRAHMVFGPINPSGLTRDFPLLTEEKAEAGLRELEAVGLLEPFGDGFGPTQALLDRYESYVLRRVIPSRPKRRRKRQPRNAA